MKRSLLLIFSIFSFISVNAQITDIGFDYKTPRKYILESVEVEGNQNLSKELIVSFSGLEINAEISIPGDEISKAITNLWDQKLFSDISIKAIEINGDKIKLLILVKTRPVLSKYSVQGVNKSEAEKIRGKVSLVRGDIVTDQLIQNASNQIKKYYQEKGFYFPVVSITQRPDSAYQANSIALTIKVSKNKRTRIQVIEITGNSGDTMKQSMFRKINFLSPPKYVTDSKIKSLLRKTKTYHPMNLLRSSKFEEDLYLEDKNRVLAYYQSLGYRDAEIYFDTVLVESEGFLKVILKINEGNKYYFRNISWTGNTKYTSKQLNAILNIKKGDVYNTDILDQKLHGSMSGTDVTTLYMDDGYLIFNIRPIELAVDGDSIDLELRIFEGPQFIINNVTVSGNDRTSDHVILRELRTRPGDKFSRTDIIRSQRELNQLGYFDPEQMNVIPSPNVEKGTVDLEYKLIEKPSDQFQLQGGWGAGQFVGTVGFVFNNFSARKLPKFKSWDPLPFGDGQKLSFRLQSNAKYYSSVNFTFTEPWFGGKKPNSFSFTAYRSFQSPVGDPRKQLIDISGVTLGIGKRLRIPDDYFTMYNAVNYMHYQLKNYGDLFSFKDGFANSVSFSHVLSRNSQDQIIYPRSGSVFELSLTWTPPFSKLYPDKDWSIATAQEKYKWMEYHKWKFNAAWYVNIVDKLVLNSKMQFGFLGEYNKDLGIIPFERYYVGGSGLSGFNLDGRELIAMRGYVDQSLTPADGMESGGTIFNKYTLELRYPLSLNPAATVYVVGFAEAGNSWLRFKDFDPFSVYRSVGLGARVYMQMFGLIGFDWGYGFDEVPGSPDSNGSHFHISLGDQF